MNGPRSRTALQNQDALNRMNFERHKPRLKATISQVIWDSSLTCIGFSLALLEDITEWVFLCHPGSRWDLFCCCRDQRISNSDPQQVISLQSGMSAAEDNVIFLFIGCDLLVVFGKEFNLTHNALIPKLQHAKHLVSYFLQFNRLKQPWSLVTDIVKQCLAIRSHSPVLGPPETQCSILKALMFATDAFLLFWSGPVIFEPEQVHCMVITVRLFIYF